MKKKIASILMGAGLCFTVQAASDSWKLDAAGNWTDAANWTGGNVPGSTTLNNNTDTATFATLLTANRVVTVDANRNIGTITFQNPANVVGTAASTSIAYTLSGGNLKLSDGGVIQVIAGSGTNMPTVSSAIEIQGDGGSATIKNDVPGGIAGLKIDGVITGSSTAGNTTTLFLDGVSTSTGIGGAARNNTVGVIGDGTAGGKLKVVKNGTGTWLIGMTGTFTGGFDINSGTIRYFSTGDKGFGNGIVTIGGDITFNHANSGIMAVTNAMIVNGNITFNGADNPEFSGAMNFNSAIRTITSGSAGNTNVTLSGQISNGGLTKAGAGVLILAGSNTYSGITTVTAGKLIVDADHVFGGTTSITVAAGTTLTLQNGVLNDYINNSASLILNSTSVLNLGFTGDDKVGAISKDGGTTWLSPGTYNAASLTASGTGAGTLTIERKKVLRLIGITSKP